MERKVYNPIQKDAVTILKTSVETNGKCKFNGSPKDKLALAWLFDISESNLPGWMSVFEFILRRQAKKAMKKGIDKTLTERYVKF